MKIELFKGIRLGRRIRHTDASVCESIEQLIHVIDKLQQDGEEKKENTQELIRLKLKLNPVFLWLKLMEMKL